MGPSSTLLGQASARALCVGKIPVLCQPANGPLIQSVELQEGVVLRVQGTEKTMERKLLVARLMAGVILVLGIGVPCAKRAFSWRSKCTLI